TLFRSLREVGAGRAAGRVFLRAPPGGVLRAVLLPEELRPARCALAPARWRYRAGARGDGAAHRWPHARAPVPPRSEEHTSELQSRFDLVCRLLLEKKKKD